jgi:hypothetical protein
MAYLVLRDGCQGSRGPKLARSLFENEGRRGAIK